MRVDRQSQLSYGTVDDDSLAALLWANAEDVDWPNLDLPTPAVIPVDGVDTQSYAGALDVELPGLVGGSLSVDPDTGRWVDGAAAIQAAVQDRIYTILGSRWLRPSYGIDLISRRTLSAFEAERRIRICLEQDSDWYQIVSYQSEQSGNALLIRLSLMGPEGVVSMEMVL